MSSNRWISRIGSLFKSGDLDPSETGFTAFSNTSLRYSDLSNADLQGARLSDVDLVGANLSGADLSEAYLSDVLLDQACLDGVNLRGARLNDVSLKDASMRGAEFGLGHRGSFSGSQVFRKQTRIKMSIWIGCWVIVGLVLLYLASVDGKGQIYLLWITAVYVGASSGIGVATVFTSGKPPNVELSNRHLLTGESETSKCETPELASEVVIDLNGPDPCVDLRRGAEVKDI